MPLLADKIPFAVMTDHPVIELDNTLLQLGRFIRATLPLQAQTV